MPTAPASRRWLLLGPLAILAGLLLAPVARAETTNATIHIPAMTTENPCTPPGLIVLSGDLHMVVRMTAAASGGWYFGTSTNYDGLKGLDLVTRYDYRAQETTEHYEHVGPDQTQTMWLENMELVSSGSPDNWVTRLRFKAVITGGVPVISVDDIEEDCRG
jgi:hypothetical protein